MKAPPIHIKKGVTIFINTKVIPPSKSILSICSVKLMPKPINPIMKKIISKFVDLKNP